jgi:hypothetical protein
MEELFGCCGTAGVAAGEYSNFGTDGLVSEVEGGLVRGMIEVS